MFASQHRSKSGEIWDVEVSTSFVDIMGGLFFSFIRDITERKRMEERQRRDKIRLEAQTRLIEITDQPVETIADYGLESAISISESQLGFLGFVRDDQTIVDIHAWSEATHEECRIEKPFLEFPVSESGIWADAVRNKQPVIINDYAKPHPKKSGLPKGHVYLGRFMTVPVIEGGKAVLIAGMANKDSDYDEFDVEQTSQFLEGLWQHLTRIKAERLMDAAKNEAEFANRAKTEFLANMSHELRTPLNTISGASQILTTEMFGSIDNPKYLEYAKNIQDAGNYLLELINDLLDISQIEIGRLELNEETLDVEEVLSGCHTLIKGRAHGAGLDLNMEIEKELPALRGDELRIKQVILNLLSNAIKFTPKGGSVTLKAGTDEEGRVVCSVADTGVGIASEDIDMEINNLGRIGDPFTRRVQGAGIGLPLSKRLVELHGGMLELESEVGIGTTVTVRFPLDRVVR